ncbi:MAG: P-type conjugative transfer protein VirB9 [Alphaproteobacteria bacterium]
MKWFRTVSIVIIFLAAWPGAALAVLEPRPLATDSRIRTVRYSPNEVFQFIGHYGYQSTIEFEEDETILTVSVGDSLAWMLNPSGNRLFLKPIEQNALTNMTVITNKRSYLFELHAAETQSIRDENMIFVVRFVYPQGDTNSLDFTSFEPMPDLERDAEKYNFNYTIRGPDLIAPLRIFDDGEFTYFEFRDKNTEIPAFFMVDPFGNEQILNYRTRGRYIVVERVGSRFTLRQGPYILCVYNERMPLPILPEPEKSTLDKVESYNPF